MYKILIRQNHNLEDLKVCYYENKSSYLIILSFLLFQSSIFFRTNKNSCISEIFLKYWIPLFGLHHVQLLQCTVYELPTAKVLCQHFFGRVFAPKLNFSFRFFLLFFLKMNFQNFLSKTIF